MTRALRHFRRVELYDFEVFLSVAEAGSFRKAAILLGVAQSAVTRRIQKLENMLGVSLFERWQGGARLTRAGTRFADDTREITSRFDAAIFTAQAAGVADNGECVNVGGTTVQDSISARALSGNGGDELFYGYERTPVDKLNNIQLDNLRTNQKNILKKTGFTNLDNTDYQINHLFRNPENFKMNYVNNLSYKEFKKIIQDKYKLNEDFSDESNYRWLELCTYVKNDLNPTLDFSSMIYSIEVRVPLLDYRLIERCLTMTSEDHLIVSNNSIIRKNILQNILKKKLKPNLIERQKRGFSLPNNLATQYTKLGLNSIEKLAKCLPCTVYVPIWAKD